MLNYLHVYAARLTDNGLYYLYIARFPVDVII